MLISLFFFVQVGSGRQNFVNVRPLVLCPSPFSSVECVSWELSRLLQAWKGVLVRLYHSLLSHSCVCENGIHCREYRLYTHTHTHTHSSFSLLSASLRCCLVESDQAALYRAMRAQRPAAHTAWNGDGKHHQHHLTELVIMPETWFNMSFIIHYSPYWDNDLNKCTSFVIPPIGNLCCVFETVKKCE